MESFDHTQFLNLQEPVVFDEFDVSALIAQSEHAGIELGMMPPMSTLPLEESSEGTESTPHGSPIHTTAPETAEIPSQTVDPNFAKLLADYSALASHVQPQPPSPASSLSPSSIHSSSASGSSGDENDKTAKKRSRGKTSSDKQRAGTRRKKARAPGIDTCSLDQIVVEGVTLREDFLLTCSLADYEKLITRLTSHRAVTPTEEHTIVQQRRRVKNRESAQESRDKKKSQVNELQHEIDGLRCANQDLSSQNAELRANVYRLEKMLSMHDALVNMWNSFAHIGSHKRVGTGAATGVLLIVLLSFGILFPQLTTTPITRGLSDGPVRILHGGDQTHHSGDVITSTGSSDNWLLRRMLEHHPEQSSSSSSASLPLPITNPSTATLLITEQHLNATVCALVRSGEYHQVPSQYSHADALRLCEAQA